MSTLTIRIPDDKHKRLKQLAKMRNISVNKLIGELSTIVIAEYDAKIRFLARAAKGNPTKAKSVLNRLDRHFKNKN